MCVGCVSLTLCSRQAPEVMLCQNYGLSADIYSLGILLWNILALEAPYGKITSTKLFEHVVERKKRPRKLNGIPKSVQRLMEQCWSAKPSERPSSKEMVSTLQAEVRTELDPSQGGDRSILSVYNHG